MKFTSEDLMKALGLQVGDKIKYYNQVFTITEELNYVGFENDTGCYNIYVLLDKDFEILPKPKRVGDLKCREYGCRACPLRAIDCGDADTTSTENTLYYILEKRSPKHLDQEIYDLLKARLDKEVQDND